MSKLRILIAEDEAVTAADLHDELTAQGYEVTGTTGSAESVLRLAMADKPDLVLMDISLAGPADGVHAAIALSGEDIPVIFLTSHYDDQTLDRAKRAKPVGYITKPFEPHQLAVAIEIGMERHRSHRALTQRVRMLEHDLAQMKT